MEDTCGPRCLLGGSTSIAPQPSVLAFAQSDQQGMWGRNCPGCEKYFRTDHIMGDTIRPYCSEIAPDPAFVSNEQKSYRRLRHMGKPYEKLDRQFSFEEVKTSE